tara:strand:+ start:965 stop:1207 length:243 start_codon:yes stop_codon:yes gene_type:complete
MSFFWHPLDPIQPRHEHVLIQIVIAIAIAIAVAIAIAIQHLSYVRIQKPKQIDPPPFANLELSINFATLRTFDHPGQAQG